MLISFLSKGALLCSMGECPKCRTMRYIFVLTYNELDGSYDTACVAKCADAGEPRIRRRK